MSITDCKSRLFYAKAQIDYNALWAISHQVDFSRALFRGAWGATLFPLLYKLLGGDHFAMRWS